MVFVSISLRLAAVFRVCQTDVFEISFPPKSAAMRLCFFEVSGRGSTGSINSFRTQLHSNRCHGAEGFRPLTRPLSPSAPFSLLI